MSDRPTAEADILRRYLTAGFEALQWKLEGLADYDLRRPLVASGTNLLGLAKHVGYVTAEYLTVVFGRPSAVPPFADTEPNADMWATADETSADIKALLATAAAEVDATLAELPLDTPGFVPWWGGESPNTTLRFVAVHVLAELHRHTGQADIVRELIDERIGWLAGKENLPGADDGVDAAWWVSYRQRLQATADGFRSA